MLLGLAAEALFESVILMFFGPIRFIDNGLVGAAVSARRVKFKTTRPLREAEIRRFASGRYKTGM